MVHLASRGLLKLVDRSGEPRREALHRIFRSLLEAGPE
jgi:hypothetical protein